MSGTDPYGELVQAWRALRATHDLALREVACVGAARTLLVAQSGDPRRPLVSLSAGMHGDEPAGPWALHALVRDRLLDPAFSYRFWPCLNPTGMSAGTRINTDGRDINRSFSAEGRTPEARAVIASNRDLAFALSIDLHEDYEASGFYLYEPLGPGSVAQFAQGIPAAVLEAGFPIQTNWEGLEVGPPGSQAAQRLVAGAVVVDARAEEAFFPDGLPMGLGLLRRGTRAALTFETPRDRAWDDRIAMHRVAVTAALERLSRIP